MNQPFLYAQLLVSEAVYTKKTHHIQQKPDAQL